MQVFLAHQECEYCQEKSCMRNSKFFWNVLLTFLSSQECDRTTSNFKSFLAEDLPKYAAEFWSFLADRDRIDIFCFSTTQISKYHEFSFVRKLLLTLSHVCTSVECGLSMNNNILKTNMVLETVIAKLPHRPHGCDQLETTYKQDN